MMEGGKLTKVRDFAEEADRALIRSRAAFHGRPRVWVNPANGLLYIGLMTHDTPVHCKSFQELVVVDPDTGRITVATLPTDPEDDAVPGIGVSNFVQIDREGHVYILCASTPYLDGKRYFNGWGCNLIKAVPGKMKGLTPGGILPLPEAQQPKRPFDMTRPNMWVEGAEWLFGPVGGDGHYGSGGTCSCYVNGRFALDYFGRSFAPEVDRFRAVVLDANGNVITRIGRYGNVDDGMPLIKDGGPPGPRSIGGDETAIVHAMNVAVHSDRRFFLADIGNQCIRSVKLGYHAEESVKLKDVPDTAKP